jgi:hypothetical protein
MTRKELGVAVGGLIIGAGCSGPAEKLVFPEADAVEPAQQAIARINRMSVNLTAKVIGFTHTDEFSIGLSPSYGWTYTNSDPNVAEVTYPPNANDAIIKSKANGRTTVRFSNAGYGALEVTVNCG